MLPKGQAPALFLICPVMRMKNGHPVPSLLDSFHYCPSLGVYSLLGRLDQKGYPCDLLDWSAGPDLSVDSVVQSAASYKVVFFSANSLNWAAALLLARKIRALNPETTLCIGGPHSTLIPEAVRDSKAFDYLFRGEADHSIHLIYENLVYNKGNEIPGMVCCDETKFKIVDVIQDRDMGDYEVAYERIPLSHFHVIPIETSRGCKHNCSFCSIPVKRLWRPYSASLVANQIKKAEPYSQMSRAKRIAIIDDCFTTNHKRVIQICSQLPLNKFAGRLDYHATLIDLMDNDLMETLAPYTGGILIGAEVANTKDAKRITKATSQNLITRAATTINKLGLCERAVFSFIIGFPWQTKEDCINTVSFATNLILDYGVKVLMQWYWAMPGSELWMCLEKENRVNIKMVDNLGFYRSSEWFYGVRKISADEIQEITKRVRPVQICLMLHQKTTTGPSPLYYSSPVLDKAA